MATKDNSQSTRRTVPQNIDELVSAVGEDPDLLPTEKETIIRWGKVDDRVHIFSEEASIVRRLIRHPLFETDSFRIYNDSSGEWTRTGDYSTGRITSIWGSIPIGAIKIQSGCRSHSAHCHVVSKDGGK